MIGKFIKCLKKIRFQKIVVSLLYIAVFITMAYTFWTFYYVGESVNPEVYNKSLDTLLGLLGVTGGLKGIESVGETVSNIAKMKYSVGSDMRGGE